MTLTNPSITDLSTELLIKIFSNLTICDLCNTRRTCKRFNNIITTWANTLVPRNDSIIVTNQKSKLMLERCGRKLSNLEKHRISSNWRYGRYKENSLLYRKTKYMPWLHLTRDSIWMSRGHTVEKYFRNNSYVKITKKPFSIKSKTKEDITRFTIKNNMLVSGQRDGSIWMWSLKEKRFVFDVPHCHSSDVNSVDLTESTEIVVSGSRDNAVKVWKQDKENGISTEHTQTLPDFIWVVTISDEGNSVAVGTSGIYDTQAVHIYDLESLNEKHTPVGWGSSGSGVTDLKWDGIHHVWGCGYRGDLRRWDLRTGRPELSLRDPHDLGMYCFETDHNNTVITGAQSHGKVMLWDIRMRKCVQIYFMNCCRTKQGNSPIYSLSFDAQAVFAATDRNLNVLDFSGYDLVSNDFSFAVSN